MCIAFNDNPCTNRCYSPTNVNEELNITSFYDGLSSLARYIPKQNVLIIGGNMNTQIGKDGNYKFGAHNPLNKKGKYRTDFTLENSVSCRKAKFPKREENLWIYTQTSHVKLQLDNILLKKKRISSALNSEAYSSFEEVLFDLRIVSTKICFSLRRNKKEKLQALQYDLPTLSNSDVINRYTVIVRNKFDTLQLSWPSRLGL